MGLKIEVNPDRCTGCRICELICAFSHEKELNPARSRIRVKIDEERGLSIPHVCNQCEDPSCAQICPNSALTQNLEFATIEVNDEECDACGLCLTACEQSSIFLDQSRGVATACDLCKGDPQCTKWCPTQALSLHP
jgi:Fe-S-cluster-containing hydrogenase component 2